MPVSAGLTSIFDLDTDDLCLPLRQLKHNILTKSYFSETDLRETQVESSDLNRYIKVTWLELHNAYLTVRALLGSTARLGWTGRFLNLDLLDV